MRFGAQPKLGVLAGTAGAGAQPNGKEAAADACASPAFCGGRKACIASTGQTIGCAGHRLAGSKSQKLVILQSRCVIEAHRPLPSGRRAARSQRGPGTW
jgi:hypothetical protein